MPECNAHCKISFLSRSHVRERLSAKNPVRVKPTRKPWNEILRVCVWERVFYSMTCRYKWIFYSGVGVFVPTFLHTSFWEFLHEYFDRSVGLFAIRFFFSRCQGRYDLWSLGSVIPPTSNRWFFWPGLCNTRHQIVWVCRHGMSGIHKNEALSQLGMLSPTANWIIVIEALLLSSLCCTNITWCTPSLSVDNWSVPPTQLVSLIR